MSDAKSEGLGYMFKIVQSLDELRKAYIVRGIVFIEEQDVPYSIEIDEHEFAAIHILGEQEGEPFAAGRVRFLGEWAKLERIAIRKSYRGRGLGHELVDFMIHICKERGFGKYKMHAQANLQDYYGVHGFETQGELFKEADIDHYLMIRDDTGTR